MFGSPAPGMTVPPHPFALPELRWYEGSAMRKFLVAGMMSLALFVPYAARAVIAVSDTGLAETGGEANYDTTTAVGGNLPAFIGTYIIQPILGVVGLIFFVLMIYAGLLWMTAAGNTDSVKKAKGILINSVIGAVIVVAAYAITSAIFNALTTGQVSADLG